VDNKANSSDLNKVLSWLDKPSSKFSEENRIRNLNISENRLIHELKIGNVKLPNNLVLAPMAGVTDGSFRLLCSRLGAGYSVSELASAKAITMKSRQTIDMVRFQAQSRPYAVQIFGSDPSVMAEAASIIDNLNICDIIDINMGCPVSKVVKIGAGSALMNDPKLASEIIKKVSAAVKIPVTVKYRLGWTENSINVKDFTKTVLDAGAQAITIHGRTREAMYTGKAQWNHLEGIKEICKTVPFFANGDITSVEDIKLLRERTNCDGFMIGRGCIGKPWLYTELLGHVFYESPEVRYKIIKHHLLDMLMEHGPAGVPLFRVHLFGYLKNHPNAAKVRHELCTERSPHEVIKTLKLFFAQYN
jgi:tRNA-dihydrouridine synthase B